MQLLILRVEKGILLSWNDHEGIVETGHLLPNSQEVESVEDDGLTVFIGQHVHMLLGDPHVGRRLEDNAAGLLSRVPGEDGGLTSYGHITLDWMSIWMKLHTALNLDTTIKDCRLSTLSW